MYLGSFNIGAKLESLLKSFTAHIEWLEQLKIEAFENFVIIGLLQQAMPSGGVGLEGRA